MTVPSALLGLGGGFAYFGSQTLDPSATILGLEPLLAYSLFTLAAAGAGALAGTPLGAAAWRARHRARLPAIEARERAFYAHIVRNRVDPARGGSAANPVPDFYGPSACF
jgi:import inner membrane translocase subunit TIM23